ncbi:MAG TPA: gliding motility-associated C-terminal domain-containing protein, partial [Saprospiraceae bacterium]|nr:gliding motility-associated C-terminal domain-containing protein [Saprospiraceae bacterium]
CTAFPNVITPTDAQSGNHKFNMIIPKDCSVRITEIELRIYNRWGALIFESTDPELPGWNGVYKDQPAPADTYTYQAIYQIEIAGQAIQRPFRRSGMFTLVR